MSARTLRAEPTGDILATRDADGDWRVAGDSASYTDFTVGPSDPD